MAHWVLKANNELHTNMREVGYWFFRLAIIFIVCAVLSLIFAGAVPALIFAILALVCHQIAIQIARVISAPWWIVTA